MKKNLLKVIISMTLALAIAAPAIANETAVPPNDEILIIQADEDQNDPQYYTFEGIISHVNEKEDSVSITVRSENDDIYIYHIYEKTPVFSQTSMDIVKNSELAIGQEVYVAYPYNTPVALSYPAQVSPKVVVIKDEEANSSVKIDMFDKDFLSSDKQLKLNLSEATDIVGLDGEKIDYTELDGSVLVVFYSITTRSLPPQTPPIKVVVLENKKADIQEPDISEKDYDDKTEDFISTLSEEQVVQRNGIRYVRLRDTAEAFGYDVSWDGTMRTATLTKDLASYTITIDQAMYGHNFAIGYFTCAPFILNERLFVEEDFVTELLLQ